MTLDEDQRLDPTSPLGPRVSRGRPVATAEGRTTRCIRFLALLMAAFCSTAPCVVGDTLFVDPVGGDDVGGDGSAAAPWKTITHAMGQLPPGHNSVLLAAGEFSQSSGEVFPVGVPASADLEILGDPSGGSIVRSGAATGRLWINRPGLPAPAPQALVSVRDLTFDNASLDLSGAPLGINLLIERTRFEDALGTAIAASSLFGDSAAVEVRDSQFERCQTAARATGGAGGFGTISLYDSSIRDCDLGVYADGFAPPSGGGNGTVVLTRCEVRDCEVGAYAYGEFGAIAWVSLFDTIIAENDVGLRGEDVADIELNRSTVAGNTIGIEAVGRAPEIVFVFARSSIVWGNGFDVDPANVIFAVYSNLPVGITGTDVTHVDPLFEDPAGGDFHLAADSPLLDAGDPLALPVDLFESDLDPRLIDGDFDGVARVDMGYDEWNPAHLDLAGAPQIGSSVTFTTTAPAASVYALLASPLTAQVPLGAPGAVLINVGAAVVLATGTVTGADVVAIPSAPVLVGLDLHAQSYAKSGFGESLSNRVDLTILP